METPSPEPKINNNNNNNNNNTNNNINNNNNYDNNSNDKSNSRRGSNTHISMSDTESQTSQLDSFYSPLRFNSPTPSPNSKALVSVESPHTPPQPTKQVHNFSRGGGAREGVRKVERRDDGEAVVDVAERRKVPAASSAVFRSREVSMRKVGLGFRVCEVVLCLVSFSVMASDRTQGWSGDSYNRYKEYRYCLAVNVIGFVYAGFQAFNSACYLASGRHILSYYLHYHFEFFMDQILAYLLMSASSSAATRVDDWVSNWGKDTFTEMATASVGVSFLAFLAFAISSLISGYNLCNRGSN